MKSLSFLHVGILLTGIALLISVAYPSQQISLLLLIVVSGFWAASVYRNQVSLNRFNTMVERVEQLKLFSVDLQSLINKELALVQEDVIRTKQIVSESIDILQNSTAEINNNIASQKHYLEVMLANLDNQENRTINTQNVNNNTCIHSMENFDKKNKSSIDNMMIALQFEDIVSQISERVAQHVGDIRSTVDILSRLCESEFSTSFQDDINKMQGEYDLIKEKLLNVSSRNLAAHKNMDEGEIDLF